MWEWVGGGAGDYEGCSYGGIGDGSPHPRGHGRGRVLLGGLGVLGGRGRRVQGASLRGRRGDGFLPSQEQE